MYKPDTTLRFACMVLLALRACRLSEAGRGREMSDDDFTYTMLMRSDEGSYRYGRSQYLTSVVIG